MWKAADTEVHLMKNCIYICLCACNVLHHVCAVCLCTVCMCQCVNECVCVLMDQEQDTANVRGTAAKWKSMDVFLCPSVS